MKKNLGIGAVSLALIFGLVSCNKKQEIPMPSEEGNTHVCVSLSMPAGLRALPDDYNKIGEWKGKDKIQSITIFVVGGNVVSTGQYEVGDFEPLDPTGLLKPKKAIKTTAGTKKVYALINGTPEVVTVLANSNAVDFEQAYKETALKLANSDVAQTNVFTSASKIAKVNGGQDVIVMTNDEECSIEVEDNVKEPIALAGAKNRAKVKVSRATARVMVTTAKDTYEVKRPITNEVIGTVSDVKWVLAQGENSFYIQRKGDYKTPKYDFKPLADDYYTTNDTGYDYSGLWEDYNASHKINGTTVPTLDNYNKALDELKLDDNAMHGKFILGTNHLVGPKGTTGFNKGNTAYVLIRAKFVPKSFADATVYSEGDDFYLGANGKFYGSKANAQNPAKDGVKGQKVSKYVGGKVLYYAWANPDNVAEPYNSPVLRNNIYHIHITGFKTIGTNWNPLVPKDDPKKPDDDSNNPDPKPNDPDEPENPIKPEDPLTTPETWMSVEVTVLPWLVHSYTIDLGI